MHTKSVTIKRSRLQMDLIWYIHIMLLATVYVNLQPSSLLHSLPLASCSWLQCMWTCSPLLCCTPSPLHHAHGYSVCELAALFSAALPPPCIMLLATVYVNLQPSSLLHSLRIMLMATVYVNLQPSSLLHSLPLASCSWLQCM